MQVLPIQTCFFIGCSSPLGLESGRISNFQLSSYTYAKNWDAYKARLNNKKAWCSSTNNDQLEYLQIDLLKVRHVSAIATQGAKVGVSIISRSYYVETFMVKYSYDGTNWFYYETSNGADVVSDTFFVPVLYLHCNYNHGQSVWDTEPNFW